MAANTRYYRFNITASGNTANPGTSTVLYEVSLNNSGGSEVNASGFGASVLSGPSVTTGSLAALIDAVTTSGTVTTIPVPFSAPMIIDMGSGRGTPSGDAITALQLWATNPSNLAALPSSFTLDSGASATGPWVNYLTVVNDDVTTGWGTTGNSSKSFAVGSPTAGLAVSGTDAGGTVGTAYSTTFTATGGTSPYTYSVGSGALPAGRTLNTSTGVVSGTPTTAGSFTYVIHAVDSTSGTALVGNSATQTGTIAASGSTTLTVAGTAGNATVGTAYSAQFTASGGTSPYTYSVGSGSLPAGVTLNTSSGLVSGTPTTAGSSTFVIHAVDSTT